ncbi:RNA polymerase sigma-70 factor [Chitinophaga sp. MM2321]|uniref:RNA polymerase sigma-70 factor n=1 Tax=Chitinophaga sp. MM2321 TaxID=3137178 RepID=UPI0032D5887C
MSAYSLYSDSELLDFVKSGDKAAFDEVYQRHWNVLFKSAYYLLQDKAASMDIVQDVFVWLWEHRDHLVLTTLRGYLIMAVRYKVANYVRNSKVRTAFIAAQQLQEITDTSEEWILELKELKAIIAHFTEALPSRCKEVFYLSRQEHLSNREIAHRLGISEKTVENQLTTALKKLRVRLGSMSVLM